MNQPRPVVTISAPFGTGGSTVGARVAQRLGVPFLDRAIPVSVAWSLAVPIDDALHHDERSESTFERMMEAVAMTGAVWSAALPPGTQPSEQAYRQETERVICRAADQSDGCVILGRAAALVLSRHPRALFVRLEGSFERRMHVVAMRTAEDEGAIRRVLEGDDRRRRDYFRRVYKADPADARLYHLVVDSTVLGLDATVDLVVTAARARGDRAVS